MLLIIGAAAVLAASFLLPGYPATPNNLSDVSSLSGPPLPSDLLSQPGAARIVKGMSISPPLEQAVLLVRGDDGGWDCTDPDAVVGSGVPCTAGSLPPAVTPATVAPPPATRLQAGEAPRPAEPLISPGGGI